MRGESFEAVVRLTNKRGDVLAMPGGDCGKVPDSSLGWLESSGRIKRKTPPPKKSTTVPRRRGGELGGE